MDTKCNRMMEMTLRHQKVTDDNAVTYLKREKQKIGLNV